MAIGIYKILFSNRKFYIGRSTNISRRFSEHKRSLIDGRHYNKLLQQEYNKCGMPEFQIVELVNNEFLIKKEQEYLNHHYRDILNLNIINIAEGFGSGADCPNSKFSKIEILSIFRELYLSTASYASIALKLNKSKSLIANIANQGRHIWLFSKYPNLYNKMLKNNKIRLKGYKSEVYKVVSPSSIEYEFLNIKAFAKEHGISETGLQRVLRKELTYTSGGWRLSCTPAKQRFSLFNRNTKEVVYIDNVSDFCRKYLPDIDLNTSRCGINRIKSGKVKKYKEWSINESI